MRRRWRELLMGAVLGLWQLATGSSMPAKAFLAQALLQHAWNATDISETRRKPWPWADTWPTARLKAERVGVDLIVLADGSGRNLSFGPGLLLAGATPGARGNTIIAGHRDTHFVFLKELELGDRLIIETPGGEELLYIVDGLDVVDSTRAQLVLDTKWPRLTLVTRYPFDSSEADGPLRYLVSATLQSAAPIGT